jgi:hypothetical protein
MTPVVKASRSMPGLASGSSWSSIVASISIAAFAAGCSSNSTLDGSPHKPAAALTASTQGKIYRGLTVTHWQSSFVYGGVTYAYRMVGTDPSAGPATTTIPVAVVPLALTFSDGKTIDGTAGAQGAIESPLFIPSKFPEGTTQYGDAAMRGEFWNVAGAEDWHVLLGTPTVTTTQIVTVPAADGSVTESGGQEVGTVTFAFFIDTMEPLIISQLAIAPTSFTVFITGPLRVREQNGSCCFTGIHTEFTSKTESGTETFTTAWAPVGAGSVDALSHEMAEWASDPFNDNVVPWWTNPSSGRCDSNHLEVADPLVDDRFQQGGWQLQDVAFFPWFSLIQPSTGYNGQYDFRGILTSPAVICVPKH